jgi:endoglucanase
MIDNGLKLLVIMASVFVAGVVNAADVSWIRINQLGYPSEGVKVAVLASKVKLNNSTFELIDASTSQSVYKNKSGKDFGAYGPFVTTFRLDFTSFKKPGKYFLKAGDVRSSEFEIGNEVYKGAADFVLRYMRQQRSGYNPFLKDSCHTNDGYTVYGPMKDGTFVDVSGGWHDATDYLQYVTTSANATYHLLAAWRDFPTVFGDQHLANGLDGKNGRADVFDEALWGMEWLDKMHPRSDWMFNQLADDRDHAGFRLPTKDSVDYGYGKGKGRPVYFVSGEVQGLGKHQNRATGTASTAGKFASAFALASGLIKSIDSEKARRYHEKSISAYEFGLKKPGVAQTAPNKARYFYEEDNWVDDMELGAAAIYQLTGEKKYRDEALKYSTKEKITPWIGADTARHYQWYPFHNFGHYELALKNSGKEKERLISYYREGIERVWNKAKSNAFYRGVPFIWCSNNLTASFAIQCYLYRKLSGDQTYAQLEQATFDWLFGLNPWGTSMVYGLPSYGDTPVDPHSSLTHLYKYSLDGGLVDGPVYGSIYNGLLGIQLGAPDEYAEFQSSLAVYHDDYGDYSTNEPTMDGTASLIYLLAAKENESREVGSGKK